MEERYATGKYIQVPINEKATVTDLSGDFALPDYQPEIKRLLRVSACVLPPSKFIGDNEGELSGSIDYYVHYIGSDNQVYCAPLSTEYKAVVPMDKNDLTLVNMTADAELLAENVGGRVTSPRKLNIKCRLRTRARMYGDMPIDSSYATLGGDNQVLFCREEVARRLFSQSEVIHLSDEIIQSRDSEVRVISADGRALISEVTAVDGAVRVKGEMYLRLVMCREPDGVPYVTLRRIPFNESVALEGADSEAVANARGSMCELNIDVEEDRIGIDLGMILEVSACKNEEVAFVKDLYSTTHTTECTYRRIPVLKGGRAFNSNFTQSDSMTLEEAGMTPEHKLIDITGYACPETADFEDGRWIFGGKSKFCMLVEKDGEYSNIEIELPYRYAVDARPGDGEGSYASASGEVINARARLDGERIGIDAEVMLCGVISCPSNVEMLDGVEFGDEVEVRRGEYVICYPSSTDTLWSVAKRYGKTVSSLASANKLSQNDAEMGLTEVDFLIV